MAMNDRDDPNGYGPDDYGPDADDAYAEEPPRRRGLTSALVVLLGIGVFGAIIWYAYSQGTRAGSETVAPILRADATPTKVKPETPGGLQVPHQDKLVYERLNPGGAAEPGVERLLPPPELPLERPKPPEPVVAAPAEPAAQEPAAPQSAPPAAPPAAPPTPTAADTAPAAGAPRDLLVQPSAPVAQAAPPAAEPPKPEPVKPEPAKPAPPAVTPAQTAQAAPPAQTAQAPVTGGVRLQIAAVDSEAKAAAEWARIQRRFPAELGGLGVRYVRADLGAKGVFYRIQAGPVEEARAKEICAVLKTQNVGCILVRN